MREAGGRALQSDAPSAGLDIHLAGLYPLKRLRIGPEKLRKSREELRSLMNPQEGVHVLKGQFGRPTRELPGVMPRGSATSSP